MVSLSSSERKVLQRYTAYANTQEELITNRNLHLALVLSGVRNGMMIAVPFDPYIQRELTKIFADIVPYQLNRGKFYIGKNEAYLDSHNLDNPNSIQKGRFLDYPETSIKAWHYYTMTDGPILAGHWKDFLNSDKCTLSPIEYSNRTFLVEYIPCPTSEGLNRALDCQRQYEQALNDMDVLPIGLGGNVHSSLTND